MTTVGRVDPESENSVDRATLSYAPMEDGKVPNIQRNLLARMRIALDDVRF
jgi:hypothetical protein